VLSLARQLNLRTEERINERTRIARELHDSLLQGFQGLMFRLQAVRDLLPMSPNEAAKELEIVLDRGDDVLAEGRSAVEDLRAPVMVERDLVEALGAVARELSPREGYPSSPIFRILVEGTPRVLDPDFRDEAYRIAREALRNAFRHAQAQSIEAEMTFGDSRFLLRIRDDGRGIDPAYLDQGSRSGHWGLPGMRERATRLGGQLEVWSESKAGTEVELSVPASIAYRGSSSHGRFRFLRSEERSQIHEHKS
jgi:signal transduction histidine kinase